MAEYAKLFQNQNNNISNKILKISPSNHMEGNKMSYIVLHSQMKQTS